MILNYKNSRSQQLTHKPRGIVKWAPFNSLPEFTEKQKQLKKQINDPDIKDYDEDKEYYFNDIHEEE